MRTERTPEGEQGVLAATPARAVPTGKLRARGGQREVSGLPLFAPVETSTQAELDLPPALTLRR